MVFFVILSLIIIDITMKLFRTLYVVTALLAMTVNGMVAQTSADYFMHTVTKGQSLYSISKMYNVTVNEIIGLNPGSSERIKAGESLRIPQKDGNHQVTFHTIQAGETLYQLTKHYGVSALNICQANPGLSAKNFRIGQVIAIPRATEMVNQVEEQKPKIQQTQPQSEGLMPNCRDMHKVQRKETIYSISKLYNITEEELIAANPEIKNNKLKKGKFLCIPYSKDSGNKHPDKTNNPGNDTFVSDAELFQENKTESKKFAVVKAAVLLSFHTEGNVNRDEQVRMIEFYEGFLMAVDSLKQLGVSVDLYTFDTGKTISSLTQVLENSNLKNMDIIFGPTYNEQVKTVANFAKENKIRLVVPFTSKSDEVFDNPYVFQVNTPQSYLFSEVYEHYIRKFPNANVIFLDAETGDNDKAEFIKGLKYELDAKQITYKELKGNAITPEGMKTVVDSLRTNVVIPTSGKNIALIKVIPQLIITSREHPNYNLKLFGYPEWQTYTHDQLSNFFELDTYFYSSFYTNNLFPNAIRFISAYRKWYSKDMTNTYPKYGMLGFDIGYFFLKGLHEYGTNWEDNIEKVQIDPIQTGFKFERVNNWGGFINRKVFFVNYTKNFELIKLDFD